MQEMFVPRSDWILAGALCGWGDPLIPRFSHVVFLTLAPTLRLARLRQRGRRRHGDGILPRGPREREHRAFLDYAMSYDASDFPGRNRLVHETWLRDLPCPVIRLDAASPPEALADHVLERLDRQPAEA